MSEDEVIKFPGKKGEGAKKLSVTYGYKACSTCDKLSFTLKRDTPLKVIRCDIMGGLFDGGGCPNCGQPVIKPQCYCSDCGQKLDWRESNE